MFKFLFNSKQKQAENELVDTIIKSMNEEPEKWRITEHIANL